VIVVYHLLASGEVYLHSSSSPAMPAVVFSRPHQAKVERRILSLEIHHEVEEPLESAEFELVKKDELHSLRQLSCPLSARLILVALHSHQTHS